MSTNELNIINELDRALTKCEDTIILQRDRVDAHDRELATLHERCAKLEEIVSVLRATVRSIDESAPAPVFEPEGDDVVESEGDGVINEVARALRDVPHGLSTRAQLAVVHLAALHRPEVGGAYPAASTLGRWLGVGERQARRVLRELAAPRAPRAPKASGGKITDVLGVRIMDAVRDGQLATTFTRSKVIDLLACPPQHATRALGDLVDGGKLKLEGVKGGAKYIAV